MGRLTEVYLSEVIPLAEYQRRRKYLEQHQKGLSEQEQQLTRQVDRQKELARHASVCRSVLPTDLHWIGKYHV